MMSRFRNLLRGAFGEWIGRREQRHPAAVYQAAIDERLRQYSRLRSAAAGVLYMRGKLTSELDAKAKELAGVEAELMAAIEEADDELALLLISRRDALRTEKQRLEQEVGEVSADADAAKRNLITFQDEIVRLRDEKVRMVARWLNARARRRFSETLRGLSLDADIRALDEVRDHIQRSLSEVQLTGELGKSAVEERLLRRREAEALAAAKEELARLKRARHPVLLPVVLPT